MSFALKVGDGVSYLFPATVYGHVILIQFILVLITAVLVEVLGVRHGWVASN